MRKYLRSIRALVRGQISDWVHSPRTVIMILIIIILAYINGKSFEKTLADYSLTSHAGDALYIYLSRAFGNLLMISAYFLIMMSEIPRRIPAQLSMLMRTTRLKWLHAQTLFCALIPLLMIGMLSLLSMALTFPYLTPGSGWSMMSSDPGVLYMPEFIPEFIRAISPLQANLLALAMLFAFWFTMVLVILLFSLAGKPNVGLIIYVSILMLASTLTWESFPPWLRAVIPTNYATLANISALFPGQELSTVPIVLLIYAAVDALLIGGMILIVKRMDMQFTRKDMAV